MSRAPIADEQAPERGSVSTLLIDDQRVPLRDDTDLDQLIDDLLNAVRASGAFVHIEGRFGRAYDVLVTPTSKVLVYHQRAPEAPSLLDAPWSSGVDLEY